MQTIKLNKDIYVVECASVAGQKEALGPYSSYFDILTDDDSFGFDNWDEAESFLQQSAVETLLRKLKYTSKDIDCCLAGDLLEESTASSFGLKEFHIPHFGVFGACSTLGETFTLASLILSGGFAQNIVCVTSSHFASAEVAFRFPLHYGNQRPLSATRTVTGSGAFLLSTQKSSPAFCRISALTPGRIVDYGITDSMNMGAAMAPAAYDTLKRHFENTHTQPGDYDKIVTGDLGVIGQQALIHLLDQENIHLSHNTFDCGRMIYGANKDFHEDLKQAHGDLSQTHTPASALDTNAGGSGCGCSALMLSAYFLPKLKSGEFKKILFMPTGALLSKNSFQEGRTIPGIAHAIVLESIS